MRKPTIKIAIPPRGYSALEKLALTVIESMTANVINFPSPAPPLATLQLAATLLKDAIAAWGPVGSRGGKKELTNLRNASIKMRNLLIREAAYVTSQVDMTGSAEEQATFIYSSGFAAKNERSPQGLLQAVRNFHVVISPRLNKNVVKLRWQKPLNVSANANVKVYLVFRSVTEKFSDALFLDAATKTTFTDYNPVKGVSNFYFIVPFNNAGRGAISEIIMVDVH